MARCSVGECCNAMKCGGTGMSYSTSRGGLSKGHHTPAWHASGSSAKEYDSTNTRAHALPHLRTSQVSAQYVALQRAPTRCRTASPAHVVQHTTLSMRYTTPQNKCITAVALVPAKALSLFSLRALCAQHDAQSRWAHGACRS